MQTQKLEQSIRLTATQTLQIKQTILQTRLDLIEAVHGSNYQPNAVCPKCRRDLTPLEIIQGFRQDPNDYTTQCTSCHARFEPKLRWSDMYASGTIPFYCASQVLAQLGVLQTKTPEQIQREEPAIYHSVRVHHGNLRRAFEKIGIQYAYEMIADWKEKVADFLGKLPDTVVAEVVDVSVETIRNLRKSLGIKPFSKRELADELASYG